MRSSLTVRKKVPMRMETSLEPKLDLSLKIHLASNILNPNRKELKEAAYVMQDMLDALEQGKTELDPRIDEGPASNKKPKNRVMQDKYERKQQEMYDRSMKQYQFENRDQVLKKKLAQHQYNKQIMKQYELIKVKEEKAKQMAPKGGYPNRGLNINFEAIRRIHQVNTSEKKPGLRDYVSKGISAEEREVTPRTLRHRIHNIIKSEEFLEGKSVRDKRVRRYRLQQY